jgi:hypothetical protein
LRRIPLCAPNDPAVRASFSAPQDRKVRLNLDVAAL